MEKRIADDLNSPKRAERNYPSPRRVASSLNFSHSFAGRTCSQFCAFPRRLFLPLSFATSLPPTRFRTSSWKLVFQRLCSRYLRSSRVALLALSTTPLSPLLSSPSGFRDFFLVCLAADWNLLSFQSPSRTIRCTIIMTLLEKRLNGLWLDGALDLFCTD